MTFNRALFKENAKTALKRFYWVAFAVMLVLNMVAGVFSGGSSSVSSSDTDTGSSYIEEYDPDDYESSEEMLEDIQEDITYELQTIVTNPLFYMIFLTATVISLLGYAFTIFVVNPLTLGKNRFFLEARVTNAQFGTLGSIFKLGYGKAVLTEFMKQLFVWLWGLLFVIPGWVAHYRYWAVGYIAAENPQLGWKRTLELSKKMTNGYKWELFVLDLSFLGWHLLSFLVCCGIGEMFLAPYIEATYAEAYTFLKQRAIEDGVTSVQELPGIPVAQPYMSYAPIVPVATGAPAQPVAPVQPAMVPVQQRPESNTVVMPVDNTNISEQ